ncbi:MAG: hypothetical protein HN736_08080 [Anaerolineae bacterium]|jgi:hypothetical protein|nr:hypothetical protein [Anaerolineae bacterium]MBT3712617.1 hypothetical protein [Anaerolineae bacterium]MBT4312320.1 hypothetical protein [Anaerolineae bacterium]MBT4457366.1 hypothetical protein [Anaerolineae bacterium]MBT4842909.1 hypothetical protein [Anaerolineae bacterium]
MKSINFIGLESEITNHVLKSGPRQQKNCSKSDNSFMSLGRILGPIWGGIVLDINLFYLYITGSFTMTSGFIAALVFLRKKTAQITIP